MEKGSMIGKAEDAGAAACRPDPGQLEMRLEQVKGLTPVFEPLPRYDVETASGTVRAGFLPILGTGESGPPQKLFCYLGIPGNADPTRRVPGVVLIHGGGGFAYAEWVEEWMKRGYAAITVDNYGYMPREDGQYYNNEEWPEQEPMYRATPTGMIGGGFDLRHPEEPLEKQGMFHVVAANILAGNLLRSQETVDGDKIGITGISWGGFTTCIVIAYDQRFAFAAPVYGCACLSWGPSYFAGFMRYPERVRLWEVGGRLGRFAQPILWVNDSQDNFFPPNCTSQCFLESVSGTILLKRDLLHYHKFDIEEIYDFADWAVRGGEPLPAFTETADASKGRDYWLPANLISAEDVHAELYYLTEPLCYQWRDGMVRMNQQYEHLSLGAVEDGRVHIQVPPEAAAYFVELWRGERMTSTPFVEFYPPGERKEPQFPDEGSLP